LITQNRYVIAVNNLAASADYYRDVLGFSIREIGDSGWRFFERDSCIVMAGECVDALPASKIGDHAYFAYLVLDDVDAYYEQVRAAGAKIIKPIRNEPWGMREFGLMTLDGHRMMLGTPTR
jgi:uncharacterized glyoxalase superfamily protein PhnB